MKFPDPFEIGIYTIGVAVCALVIALCGVAGWSMLQAVRSTGEVDYCYIEMQSPTGLSTQFQLLAHRPWRSDRIIGSYFTMDEAKAKADLLNCPVQKK